MEKHLLQSYKICDEKIEENTEYTKRLGFEITKTKKDHQSCIPKIHKNSTGARFIIASKICSRKQISKFVCKVFNILPNWKFSQNNFLSDYNKFWVWQIADPIIQSLNNINDKKFGPNLFQHMTLTLHTKLPYDKLKSKLLSIFPFIRLSNNGTAFGERKQKEDLVLVKHN